MATVSFAPKKPAGESAPAPAPTIETALAPVEEKSLALGHVGDISGDIDLRDLEVPKLNVVQKTGNLSDDFPPGAVVLAKSVLLTQLKNAEPFRMVVLSLKKQFQEDLPYDASGNGPRPKTFSTVEEVRAAGGSTNYGDENYYVRTASLLALVEAPAGVSEEDLDSYFFYEHDGKRYALVMWFLSKSAFTAAAKTLITAREIGHLRQGYHHGAWLVSTEQKTNAGNTWYVPKVKPAGKTTPEFQQFAAEILG